jgi:hypothetical protein
VSSVPSQDSPRRSSRLLNKSQQISETQAPSSPKKAPKPKSPKKVVLEITGGESKKKRRQFLEDPDTHFSTEDQKPKTSKGKAEPKKDKKAAQQTEKKKTRGEKAKTKIDQKPKSKEGEAESNTKIAKEMMGADKRPLHPFFLPKPKIAVTENPFKLTDGEQKPFFFLPSKEKVERRTEISQQRLKEDVSFLVSPLKVKIMHFFLRIKNELFILFLLEFSGVLFSLAIFSG